MEKQVQELCVDEVVELLSQKGFPDHIQLFIGKLLQLY